MKKQSVGMLGLGIMGSAMAFNLLKAGFQVVGPGRSWKVSAKAGAAGTVSGDPGAAAVTLDTVFDLASLTKPLATTLALMVLAGRGQLESRLPDAPRLRAGHSRC